MIERKSGYLGTEMRHFPTSNEATFQRKDKIMQGNNLLPVAGGFDDDDDRGNRLLIGAKAKCGDGQWSASDGSEMRPDTRYLVRGTLTAAQHWQKNLPVETIVKQAGKPFIDVDEANARIPQTDWEMGIDGKPRPPWQVIRVVYLIRIPDGKLYTHLAATYGTKIAVSNLREQVSTMRMLRGSDVVPIVRLDKAPFKTRYGMKIRPDFIPVAWREIGGAGLQQKPAQQIEHQPEEEPALPGKPVEPVTSGEVLDDEIPF
jgi:hypothetical protein